MSLEVDGVWKAGVWATTVWADGVWREGDPPIVLDVAIGTRYTITFNQEDRNIVFETDERDINFNAEDREILL